MKLIKPLILSCLYVFCSYAAQADVNKVLFTEALKKNMITFTAQSVGGYQGQCLEIDIKNRTSGAIDLTIDPALIFRPSDTSYQDLVAAGGNLLALKPRSGQCIVLQTFCGKSYARGPKAKLEYKFWKKGDEVLVNVAKFIQEHRLYNSIGQHAVWSLTNNHLLSGIYSPADTGLSKKLVRYIAGMTGRPVPHFYTTHKVQQGTSDGAVYNPTIEKYVVVVEWQKPSSRNMHVLVHKENGELFWEEKNEIISKRGHKVIVELDPKKVPKGSYVVMLRDDDNTVYQRNEVLVE